VLDGIFHQGLQQHGRNHHVERVGFMFFDHVKFIPAEADYLDIEIVVDKLQLFPQRHKRIRTVEEAAKYVGQLDDHLACRIGIEAYK